MLACERGRIGLDEVFGPEAKGFIASLNTEGHHRGAVAAVKSQQLKEVRALHFGKCACGMLLRCHLPHQHLPSRQLHSFLRSYDMCVIPGILSGV